VGAARRVAAVALHQAVDGHLRHPPPRGQLAAGDGDHPAGGLVELGLAGDVDRLLRVPGGDQRPHPREGAGDVGGSQPRREELVDGVEQVRHVVGGGLHVLEVALVVVVGGPDQRLAEPREHEDRPAPARRGDRAGHQRERGARQHDVRAAARADHGHLGLVVELLRPQPVRPHPGRVDHARGAHLELLAAGGVPHARADRAASLLEEPDRLDPVGGHGAEALRLGQHRQHEPCVVGLAVVEQVAAGRLAARQRGQQLRHLLPADDAVAGRAPVRVLARAAAGEGREPVDRHHVVHVQPDAGQPVGPRPVEGGHDQRQRADEMGRERDVDLALQQRLAHQPEVEVLEVAQAAVDELARARGRADRVVAALHQRHGAAARRRVERDAGPGDAAADHEHVERLGGESADGVRAREHRPGRLTAAPRPPAGVV